ncbi:hypothetical protein IU500_19360 [Nocardia terpenica]|uniref:hypothetical protein n=1 Tax=Nocardia terpenica TaxID=455432 RepID=UPI001895EDF4|nr:hypothetical protein [Nocardia terpenica]MBF6062003.1 hypothetical protein [Nocardia terpenica]MBF6106197.1 hypothetical protein [Nocardia terpenica]MBF6110423.1 hypothetical protein [Nocardia terpenica]MBF6120740.1 hypothetical protein [Nocardia terpenica]MBF6151759.1 hypothetical protein [Nocardia terpenica]
MAIAATEIDQRLHRRRRDEGLAARTDLRRYGLDARSATGKASLEYPKLVARQCYHRIHVRRRR